MPSLTPPDESYTHQLVAPAAVTQHVEPGWAERCYHLLHVDEGTILHAGRALYAHAGRRSGFAGVTTGAVQHALRVAAPFRAGDDPDDPTVGPLRIEAVRPLEEIRLVLDEPGSRSASTSPTPRASPPCRPSPTASSATAWWSPTT